MKSWLMVSPVVRWMKSGIMLRVLSVLLTHGRAMDILVQRSQDKFPLHYPRVRYDQLASQIVQCGSLRRGSCIDNEVIVGENV